MASKLRETASDVRFAYGLSGKTNVSAIVAQLLAAIEMNWSLPCGKPDSKYF